MTSIIKDNELNQHLLDKGYVTFPFFNETEMAELAGLFSRSTNMQTNQKGLYSNLYFMSSEQNWQISEELEQMCGRAFGETFYNAKLNGGVFIAKGVNPDTGCFMHQDPTCTLETQYATYSIWIPLVDINETTGLFYAVEGSHKMRNHVRCYNNPSKDIDINTINKDKLKALTIKAGHALVFDHALVHGSAANLSDKVRIAVVMGVVPNDTPFMFFWKTAPGQFAAYNMSKEHFIKKQVTELRQGKVDAGLLNQTITAPENADMTILG